MKTNLVVCPVFERASIISGALEQLRAAVGEGCDILVVDDGSEDGTADEVKTGDGLCLLRSEMSLGYGAAMMHAIEYARDLEYECIIFIDIATHDAWKIPALLLEHKTDADIVNLSRVRKPEQGDDFAVHDLGRLVCDRINSVTGYELVDPFSSFRLVSRNVFEEVMIEEYDEAGLIQFWVQSAFNKFSVKEIFADGFSEQGSFDESMSLEKDQDYYLDFIEAEKLLFPISQ